MTKPCILVIVLVIAYMRSLAAIADFQELRSQQPSVGDSLHPQRRFSRQPAAVATRQSVSEQVEVLEQRVAALTLRQCVSEAIERSPELAALRHQIEAASNHITKKRSTTLPYLGGSPDAYEVNGAPVTPVEELNIFPQISAVVVKSGEVLDRKAHWIRLVSSPSV
jgi:hypothetical protein